MQEDNWPCASASSTMIVQGVWSILRAARNLCTEASCEKIKLPSVFLTFRNTQFVDLDVGAAAAAAAAPAAAAPAVVAMTSTTLRAVTHRLTTTPVDQLPAIASFLATSLTDCAELLSTPSPQKSGKADSDNAVQIHKLKTRLASLLQDRSVEGRWTAVVLVKATVEAGQWEILRGYEPIVRSLIGILAV